MKQISHLCEKDNFTPIEFKDSLIYILRSRKVYNLNHIFVLGDQFTQTISAGQNKASNLGLHQSICYLLKYLQASR